MVARVLVAVSIAALVACGWSSEPPPAGSKPSRPKHDLVAFLRSPATQEFIATVKKGQYDADPLCVSGGTRAPSSRSAVTLP